MINIKNLIENIIYIIIIGLLMALNTYIIMKHYEEIVNNAINKNTTEIVNKIDKIKTTKGSAAIDLTNHMQMQQDGVRTPIGEGVDTISTKPKSSWLKNIFKHNHKTN